MECRRGAVLTLVSLSQVVGEDQVWNMVEGKLTSSQEKLLAVYQERSKRRDES